MNGMKTVLGILPDSIRKYFEALPEDIYGSAEEIRLRTGQAMTVLVNGSEKAISGDRTVTVKELERVCECATEASLHSAFSELSNGFIYVDGGVRIGVCGTAVVKSGAITGFRSISSLAIRIPREIKDCALDKLLCMTAKGLANILIISRPGGGKTTCLRSFVRAMSNQGHRVSVADERGEISALKNGVPQFDIGRHSDVIFDAPKTEAAMMLIRAMNPEILAMDEISSKKDIDAVFTACGCGVKILATAHAESIGDLKRRPMYRELLSENIFEYCLVITNRNGVRSYTVEEL